MKEQRTMKQEKKSKKQKQKLKDNIHPPVPLPQPVIKQPHPTICNNNTMNIEFLVQMRQSDKCRGVRNDDIFNLHL